MLFVHNILTIWNEEFFYQYGNHGKVGDERWFAKMKPNCFSCLYFAVTWDQNNPRGCRAYGFQTRELPSVVVKKSSGLDCLRFEEKKKGSIR